MSNRCKCCGHLLTLDQQKLEQSNVLVTHTHNHVQHIDRCVVYSDAFYEVIEGPRKGGLIHRWDATNTHYE